MCLGWLLWYEAWGLYAQGCLRLAQCTIIRQKLLTAADLCCASAASKLGGRYALMGFAAVLHSSCATLVFSSFNGLRSCFQCGLADILMVLLITYASAIVKLLQGRCTFHFRKQPMSTSMKLVLERIAVLVEAAVLIHACSVQVTAYKKIYAA